MEQMLRIHRIPMEYQLNIQPARLEYQSRRTEPVVSRERGGLQIRTTPARLEIDTFEASNSVMPTVCTSVNRAAEKGKAAAQEATARYAREGRQLLAGKKGQDTLGEIFRQRMLQPDGSFELTFLPKARPEFTYVPAEMEMRFVMDRLHFDWRVREGETRFYPGSVELLITQMPSVEVEYTGEPRIVPPPEEPAVKKE